MQHDQRGTGDNMEKGNCVECGKAFSLERTGKHCKECFNIDNWKTTYPPRGIEERLMEKGFFHKVLPFVWIQESRTGRSSRYWDDEKQEYVLYEDDENE